MNNTPKVGEFYKHFKHDPEKGMADHIYQVIGVGCHTETEEVLVLYTPLYSSDYLIEKEADVFCRPLSMFIDEVEKEAYAGPRFIKIIDDNIVDQLKNL